MKKISIKYPKPIAITFQNVRIGHAFFYDGQVFVKTDPGFAIRLHCDDKDATTVTFNSEKNVHPVETIEASLYHEGGKVGV